MSLVLAASVPGSAHARTGLPCQDAFRIASSDGALVLAVADGLGSAARSDAGAAVATEAAATRALDVARCDTARAAVEGIVAARDALETLAATQDHDLADLACTLIVVVVAAERIGIAHIGDGAAVGMVGDQSYLLSPPGASEYVNEVDPLTADDWIDNVRTVVCVKGVEAIGVFTDGCHHAAVRRDNGTMHAHGGFFAPLLAYARSGVSTDDGSRALGELLGGAKMSEHSDDDKTLVLAVL